MIYTLVCALIEKLNKDNEIRKQTESDEKYRREQEREAEEMVLKLIFRICLYARLFKILLFLQKEKI